MKRVAPAAANTPTVADLPDANDYWFQLNGLPADETPLDRQAHYWSICERFHVSKYQAIRHRDSKPGCAICRGRVFIAGVNDFATTHPSETAYFVRPGPSGGTPETTSALSNRMATWRCDRGHEFDAQFRVMAQHERHHCTCARHKRVHRGVNDLASRNPILARQWDTDRNGKGPDTVTVFSSRPVWWTCPAGHHFRTSPVARRFLPPGANGCQQCWLSSPIDPDLHRHRVAPELCPTPDELDRYFETPRDRSLRPTTSQKHTTAGISGRRRAYTRYSDETKAAAISLYAELRDSHRSRQATDRAVAAQLGIRDLGNIKKWQRQRGADRC